MGRTKVNHMFSSKKEKRDQPPACQSVGKVKEDWKGKIERLAWGGLGVARKEDGRLLLLSAPLALFPGEEVEAEISWKARHGEGVVRRWVKQDPCRSIPECPVAESCGGCDLWGAGVKGSELKRQMVEDLLRRQLPTISWTWSPAPLEAKRHRIQLHWDGKALGFHKRRSHQVVAVQSCHAAAKVLSNAIPRLQEALQERVLPTKSQRWEIATGTPAHDVFAIMENGRAWKLEPDGWHSSQEAILHTRCGISLRHSAGGFFQVSAPWAMDAFSDVLKCFDLRGETFFDIYGGVGLFSALLGKRFKKRILIESEPSAVQWAERNLEAIQLPTECYLMDAVDWIPERLGGPDDLILADPPRSGLTPSLIEKLKTAQTDKMVLIGCDGAVFCRDILRLASKWQLEQLKVLDLFPLTSHAEFVGLLKRSDYQ